MRLIQTIAALAGCAAFAFIVYATLSPIGLRPIVTTPHFEHFAAFCVVAGLFAVAFPRNRLAVLVSMLVLAGGLELAQLGISGRHGRYEDFFVKAAGIAIGVAMATAARRLLPQRPIGAGRGTDDARCRFACACQNTDKDCKHSGVRIRSEY